MGRQAPEFPSYLITAIPDKSLVLFPGCNDPVTFTEVFIGFQERFQTVRFSIECTWST
jgi:hypothetical protein